jgi:hypothetical protein
MSSKRSQHSGNSAFDQALRLVEPLVWFDNCAQR